MLDYLVEGIGAVTAALLGYLMYRLKQRDKRIDALETRLTRLDKDFAVIAVQYQTIRENVAEIKKTLRAINRKL